MACAYGNEEVVELLLEHASEFNFDFNERIGFNERTPFMHACAWGNTDVVECMLDYSGPIDIDFNARDREGRVAFNIAALYNRTKVVNLLKEYPELKRC